MKIRVRFTETRTWEEDEEVPDDWTDEQIDDHVDKMDDDADFRQWDCEVTSDSDWWRK